MQDFYHADQGEEESIPSFATRVEGLLSQIWDKYPEKLTHPEEQRLLGTTCSMGVRRASGTVWSTVLQILTWIICISWRNAEKLRMRTRWDKLSQTHQKPRWQLPQYHPPGRMSWQAAQVPAAPDWYPGGSGKELGISCQIHKGLLQRGHNRWVRDAYSTIMERRFKGQRSA